MGNIANPLSLRLNNTVFWKSELYSYYYHATVQSSIKIFNVVKAVALTKNISVISTKLFFTGGVYLITLTYRKNYWKLRCSRRVRKNSCLYMYDVRRKLCKKKTCIFYKKMHKGYRNKVRNKKFRKGKRNKNFYKSTSTSRLKNRWLNKYRPPRWSRSLYKRKRAFLKIKKLLYKKRFVITDLHTSSNKFVSNFIKNSSIKVLTKYKGFNGLNKNNDTMLENNLHAHNLKVHFRKRSTSELLLLNHVFKNLNTGLNFETWYTMELKLLKVLKRISLLIKNVKRGALFTIIRLNRNKRNGLTTMIKLPINSMFGSHKRRKVFLRIFKINTTTSSKKTHKKNLAYKHFIRNAYLTSRYRKFQSLLSVMFKPSTVHKYKYLFLQPISHNVSTNLIIGAINSIVRLEKIRSKVYTLLVNLLLNIKASVLDKKLNMFKSLIAKKPSNIQQQVYNKLLNGVVSAADKNILKYLRQLLNNRKMLKFLSYSQSKYLVKNNRWFSKKVRFRSRVYFNNKKSASFNNKYKHARIGRGGSTYGWKKYNR